MLKINTLRKMEYEKHWIHIMNFGNIFQYLFADKKGNIYQHYITLPANPLRLLKYKLGLADTPFSRAEIEVGEKIILSGAMDSVDGLVAEKEKMEKKLKQTSKLLNVLKKDKRCMWRAIETKEGISYQCLMHDVVVKMQDGVIPTHEIKEDSKVLSPLQFNDQ